MATISGTLGYPIEGYTGGLLNATDAVGMIGYPITGPANTGEHSGYGMLGMVFLNRSSVVGFGGTSITIVPNASSVTVTY